MAQFNATPSDLSCVVTKSPKLTATQAISNGWGALFPLWRIRSRSRTALRGLTAHQLADIGVTPDMAARECAKWFWQA